MAKTKNKIKIGISLLIAILFLIPASVLAGSAGPAQMASEENNAGVLPTIPDVTSVQDRDAVIGQPVVGDWDVNIVEPMLPMQPMGTTDITISIHYIGTAPSCIIGAKQVLAEIYGMEPSDPEEICCYDMESVWDVYNYMNTTDSDMVIGPNGCIDTWVRSDLRAHSGTYSFHNTQFPTYLGNQHDQFYVWCCDPALFDYDTVIFDYYRWVEGEAVDLGAGYTNAQDYLDVYVVTKDALGAVTIEDYVYDAGTDAEAYITGAPSWYNVVDDTWSFYNWDTLYGVECVGLMFDWTSDPECQFEGVYIDDVCFYGQNSAQENKLWQSYNQEALGEFLFCEPQEFTFPLTFTPPEEACYTLHVQIHACTLFEYDFTICFGECLDIQVNCPTLNDPICYENWEGDVEICNIGNIDATNVPVTIEISQALGDTLIDDRVEGGDIGYTLINFVGTETENYFHISEFLSETPTHSWYWGVEEEDDCDPATTEYNDYLSMSNHGIVTPVYDLEGVLGGPCFDGPDLEFDAIWNLNNDASGLGTRDIIYLLAYFPDTGYYTFGGGYMLDIGWTSGGWQHLGWIDIMSWDAVMPTPTGWRYGYDTDCDGYRETPLNDVVDFMFRAHQAGYTAADNWEVAFGIYISSDAIKTGFEDGYPWGGFAFDNMYLEVEKPSKVLQTDNVIVDLDMGECITLPIAYDYMEVGKYIIEVSVPDDCCDFNNVVTDGHHIGAEICAPEGYYRPMTDPEAQCCFHIETSGYDNYMTAKICGPDGNGAYANNLNCIIQTPCMDWTGEAYVDLNILEWFSFEYLNLFFGLSPYDALTLWVSNDCCSEFPHFTQYSWGSYGIAKNMFDTGNFWHTETTTITDATPLVFTDSMCIRFQFTTNSYFTDRGWDVDYLEIVGGTSGTTFIADEFDTMDGWICDIGAYSLWHDLGTGCWEWSDLGTYPANMNDALVYFTDTTQAYNVDLQFTINSIFGAGDLVYVEISNDNVTWDILDTIAGNHVATVYTIPINNYVPGPVYIRFTAVSDATGLTPGYFQVCDIILTGMLDLRAPQVTCSISGVYCDGEYTSDVTVTLTATDDITGVKAIYYKLDGGAQQVYTGPITVSAEGAHTVEAWAVDNAGNVGTHINCAGFTIDKDTQAPTVSITAPTAGITIFGKTIPFGSKVIIIGGFSATATASDDSGIHSVKFYMDDVLFGESTSSPYTAYCGVKHMGAGVLKAVAYDETGKTGTATLDVTYFKLL